MGAEHSNSKVGPFRMPDALFEMKKWNSKKDSKLAASNHQVVKKTGEIINIGCFYVIGFIVYRELTVKGINSSKMKTHQNISLIHRLVFYM